MARAALEASNLKFMPHTHAKGLILTDPVAQFIEFPKVLDKTKVLHGPRTQTYGETNYLKTKFWTEPRYCMVLGLKPMGKPTT